MDSQIHDLSRRFHEKVNSSGPGGISDATVTAVNADEYSCDIMLDGLEYYEVRLRAIISDASSIDVLPAIGSNVLVGKIGEGDFLLLAADVITSWRVSVGDTRLEVDKGGIQVSRGDESLTAILTDLVKAVLSIAAAKDAAALTKLLKRIKTLLK